jgi:pyrimidine-specific ribonucleoside hydrolase
MCWDGKKTPIILDGDPGHDDAIAWMLAFARKELDVRGVVSVSGNASIEHTTRNMLQLMTLLGVKNVPLAQGASRPIVYPPVAAPTEAHGITGLDGPVMPEPEVSLCGMGGTELLAKLLRKANQPITLVPTGPLSNIASLFLAYPRLKKKIACISLMGGGMLKGNWSPAAEFNIAADPEAAKIVFNSGVPIIMAGLDVTEKAYITREDIERIRNVGNKVAIIAADILDFFYQPHSEGGYLGAHLHDPVAITALVRPEILEIHDIYVQVETSGEYCRGATIGDFHKTSGKPPNAKVIMDIDREAFVDMIVEAIEYYGEGNANV